MCYLIAPSFPTLRNQRSFLNTFSVAPCSPFRRDFPASAANRLLWHINHVSLHPALLTQFQPKSCSPEIFWGCLDDKNQSSIILSLQMRNIDSAWGQPFNSLHPSLMTGEEDLDHMQQKLHHKELILNYHILEDTNFIRLMVQGLCKS